MTPHCPGAGKGRFWCKTMAQYGTVCNICHPHLTMTYMLCHPWHHDGTHVTYDTDMESMTLSWQQWHHTVLELGKDYSGVKQWHNMAQYVIYVIPPHHDVHAMSPMTPRWHPCHLWHRHGINVTSMATMTPAPACHIWHQHVTYDTNMTPMTPTWHLGHQHNTYGTNMSPMAPACNLWHQHVTYGTNMALMTPACHLWHQHITYETTMTLMSPMTQTWHQWHTVLELGKGDFGGKQWHNMAQYVIYVFPTSPWRTCYVTHDTPMAPMSPMTQTWNQWHHHGNNDTTLSSSWERTILV